MRKLSQHNIRTSMNQRTHFFIKICLSHFIRKGSCWLCVGGELETETDCYILTQSSSRDHSSISSSSWMACSTVGRWGPNSSVWSWFSLRGLPISNCDWNWTDSNWLNQAACGTWLYNCFSSTCFLWSSHLHRIQPRPQVKITFRYLRPDAPVSLSFCLFTQVHLLIDGSVEVHYVTDLLKHYQVTLTERSSQTIFTGTILS